MLSMLTHGPLADIRVLEAGTLPAGSFCGRLLGDHGAEVITLEDPGRGDPLRERGREHPGGRSLRWPVVARNKKSVTCNLRHREGQALVRELVAHSDVLVESFRPGTLERWGLGYDTLAAVNPRLILVRVTGEPDRPPSRAGVFPGDALAGTTAAYGAVMALHARTRTDRGQVVDSGLPEAVLACTESLLPGWAVGGHRPERAGPVPPGVAPGSAYPTADGAVVLVAAGEDTVFRRLAEVMGREDLADDPRYATRTARDAHREELDAIVAGWTAGQEAAALLDALHAAGVPAGRTFTAADMLTARRLAARDAVVRVPHPEFGELPMQDVVPKLSGTPGAVRWAGPELGAHNDEVYGDLLHLSRARRRELAAEGVI